MLIRMIPSCVSIIPWKPIRPLLRRPEGAAEELAPDRLPGVLPDSLGALLPALSPPLLPGREPEVHGWTSR